MFSITGLNDFKLILFPGEIDMKLDLEDIGMCLNKSLDGNIHMVEKTTQTESFPLGSSLVYTMIRWRI